MLAVELGGTVSGSLASIRTGGKLAAELFAHARYDAVVLASGDLLLPDLDGLLAVKVPWISANVYRGGKRLAAPYVTVGDVAIVGVTDVPASGTLPPGIEVRDPDTEVRSLMPELRGAQGKQFRIVVATAQTAVDRSVSGGLVLTRAGGVAVRGAIDASRAVVVAPTATELGMIDDIASPRQDILHAAYSVSSVPVTAPLDDTARAILERYGVLPSASPSPAPVEPAGEGGGWTAKNRAAELEVFGFRQQPSFAGLQAPDGGTLVLVDTEWRNVLPLGLVYGQLESTSYRIPNLRDHLYLVADGCRLLRVAADAHGSPGHIAVRNFELPDLGSSRRGWVAFVADQPPQHSLELRFYDFAHGHLTVPLMGTAPAPTPPVAAVQDNEVVGLGVFGLRTLAEWKGTPAPAGKTFVAVDVRARSHFTQEVDAAAFDPHAAAGAKMQLGTVSDWTEAHRHAQLVVDGVYGTPPLAESPLGDAPRFLPDVPTGAEFVFLAPAAAKSLALRCDFPNARLPGGALIRPKGLEFALRGEAGPTPDVAGLGGVDDDVFRFDLLACEARVDGQERIVTCTVRVRVAGARGETFQTRDQLQLALPDGNLHGWDEAHSAALTFAPAPLLFVPPASARTFAVAFKAPLAGRLRLGYRGLTLQRFFDLPLADAAAGASDPVPPPVASERPTPPEKPVSVPVTPPAPDKPVPDKPAPEKPAPGAPAVVDQGPPPSPRGLAGVGLTAADVNRAIDRGADGLWASMQKEIHKNQPYGYYDEHILTSLALVHAGLHRRNAEFDTALQKQLQRVQPQRMMVYELGILCMLIEHYGDPAFLPTMHVAARLLFEGQGPKGSWNYRPQVAKERLADPEAEQALKVYGGVPLEGDVPPWDREPNESADGDNSTTQYALLGLRAAASVGIPLPATVWEKALAEQRARHCQDGGWAYSTGWEGYGSMTAAGIASVAICRHALGQGPAQEDPQVRAALGWLAKNFSVSEHPKQRGWEFYYLYALERVGRLLDTEFIGRHEWYPLGARHLVDRQRADGIWDGIEGHEKSDARLPSSFALLFLTRATEALSPLKQRGGAGTLRASVALPPALRLYLVLDASGSMLEPMAGRPRFEAARDAVNALLDALPDDAEVSLRVYGHRKRAIEPGAEEDTELLQRWAKLDRTALRERLAGLRARGRTPLTLSLQQALRDLGSPSAEQPVTFVLLTDGGDDTKAKGELAAAAKAITARGHVGFHVVGFSIDRPDWTEQLRKAAAAASGSYVPAADAASLAQTLRTVVFGIPDGFVVRGPDGKERRGRFGEAMTLPEGKYEVSVSFGQQRLSRDAWVNTNGHTGIVFDARKLPR